MAYGGSAGKPSLAFSLIELILDGQKDSKHKSSGPDFHLLLANVPDVGVF